MLKLEIALARTIEALWLFLNADYGCGGLKRAEVCWNMLDVYLLAEFQKPPFHALAEMMSGDCEDGDLFETCIADQLRDHNAWKLRVWAQLPALCGLPPWETLLEMKSRAVRVLERTSHLSSDANSTIRNLEMLLHDSF